MSAKVKPVSVVKFDSIAVSSALKAILDESDSFGINRSFAAKVVFGQVPEHCEIKIGEHVIKHTGIFIQDGESPAKVLDALRSAPNSTFYRLFAYWSARILHNRGVLSYTAVILTSLIKVLLAAGLRPWELLTVYEGDTPITFEWDKMAWRIEYMSEIKRIVEVYEGKNRPTVVKSAKVAPIFSDVEIDL